jgi:hypothetical protein
MRETSAPGDRAMGDFFVLGTHAKDLADTNLLARAKPVIQHEACYQVTPNEPNTDKWPSGAVQKFFQKSEKKTCHPLKC